MAKVEFYPISITYKLIRNLPVIHLFCRTIKGEQICIVDEDFKPYFYVEIEKPSEFKEFSKKIKELKLEKAKQECYVLECVEENKKLLEKDIKVVKVFVNIPGAVNEIRKEVRDWDEVKNCFEYDIPFARRYIIDKNIEFLNLCEGDLNITNDYPGYKVQVFKGTDITQKSSDLFDKLKILGFDIETYNPDGRVSDPEKNPILMISFFSNNFKKVITWRRFKLNSTTEKYIEFVEGEAELIEKTKEVIKEFGPDILTGYYSEGFDLPYIKARASKYKIDLNIGLDNSKVSLKRGKFETAEITGIIHLDILNFIRRVISRKLKTDSYTLDSVSEEILGIKKLKVPIDKLAQEWDANSEMLNDFCEYNLRDSMLTQKLCETILPNMIELMKIVSLPLYDINRLGFSQLVEWYLIKHTKDFNEIIPNKPNYQETLSRRAKTYKGAFVFEPLPGVYENIVVFDFRSLYPTIISSHNISLSTFRCDCCKGKEKVPFEKDEEIENYWFCKNKRGFISLLIDDLISRRARVKEILKKTEEDNKKVLLESRSEAIKLLSNSFYGYMGFALARWYSIESASSILAYARYYIKKVIDKAKKEKFKVIYSDTDSIFIALEKRKEKDALKFMDDINAELPELMELEYEGLYPKGIFVSAKAGEYGAKKKYALIDEKDSIKIRGFETIRRNWCDVAKETQFEVIKTILKDSDSDKALEIVQKAISDLRNKKTPNEKVIISTYLQKDLSDYESVGPHVAIAQRMRQKGIPVGEGSKISYIITVGTGRIRDRAKMIDEIKQGEYDPEYYINNQLIPSIDKIFELLGIEKDSLTKDKEQSDLKSYFN